MELWSGLTVSPLFFQTNFKYLALVMSYNPDCFKLPFLKQAFWSCSVYCRPNQPTLSSWNSFRD